MYLMQVTCLYCAQKLVENSTENKENGWYEYTELSELPALNYLHIQNVLIMNSENEYQFKLVLD